VDISTFVGNPYHSDSMFIGALTNPGFAIAVIALSAPLIVFHKKLGWSNFEHYHLLKFFILLITGITAWEFSTYDYNYYLDQSHYFDRFLLIMLGVLLYFHPSFVSLFLILSLIITSQFQYPVGGFTLTDKRALFDILLLFNCFLYLRLIIKIETITFIFLLLCMHASNYFIPGLIKLQISPHLYEWLLFNEMHMIVVNPLIKGWLVFFERDIMENLISLIKTFRVPFLIGSILIELSGLILIFRKKLSIILLVFFILLHLGILLGSGIFFWQWILIDLGFIYLLLKLPKDQIKALFNKKLFLTSLVIIIFSQLYFKPHQLGWFDTRLNHTFNFEVVDDQGNTYNLQKTSMAPYDMLFHFDRLLYHVDAKFLAATGWAVDDYSLFVKIKEGGIKSIQQLEEEYGTNHYDEKKVSAFSAFVKTYFKHKNKRLNQKLWISYFHPPYHVYSIVEGDKYEEHSPVHRMNVIFFQTYYDGEKVNVLQERKVQQIDIYE